MTDAALEPRRSVLLMAELYEALPAWRSDEQGLSDHWAGWLAGPLAALLSSHGGQLVKAVGDSLLACFESEAEAVAAAGDMLASWPGGLELPPLRIAIHAAEVLRAPEDVYGSGVNLTARLCALAGPGELWLSEALLPGLPEDFSERLIDRGYCYVKHWPVPVRGLQLHDPQRRLTSPAAGA